VATRADIEIAVKGIKQVENAKKKIRDLNKEINKSNKQITKQAEKDGVVKKGNKTAVGAASQVRSINTLNKNLAKATRNFNRVALGTEDAAEAAIQLKKAQDDLNKAYAEQNKLMGTNNKLSGSALQKQTDIARGKFAGSGPGVFGPQPRPSFAQSIGIKKGFDVESALISGAFPLLFGQGPVGALAGGIGGGVGGMFGGMGGFAGGIAATAAVQSITTFTQEIAKLGNALSRPTENIGTLVEKLGLANDPTGRLALRLEKLGLTSSASALLMEEFTRQTGKSPNILKDAAEEINEMNKSLATFGLKLQLLGTEVITPIVDLLNKIPFGKVGKGLEPLSNFILFGPGGGKAVNEFNNLETKQNFATDNSFAANRGLARSANSPAQIGKTSAFEALANEADFNKNIRPLKQALEIEQKRLTLSTTDLNLLQEKFKLSNLQNDLKILEAQAMIENNDKLTDQIRKLKIVVDTQQQIVDNAEHLSSNFQKIGRSIASGITDNLSAAIMQTKSLGDAAKSILNDLSSTLIRLGVNTLLGGLTGGAGGIFGSLPMLSPRANGGPVKKGGNFLVGEKGPELFVPKRSGTIIPNDKLGGGSTNISVNVDASGSSVQSNEQQGKELGRVISAAIQSELIKQRRPGGLLR